MADAVQRSPSEAVQRDPVQRFLAALERDGIPICHWKGAAALARGLAGERDLDFLVAPEAFGRSEAALATAGFKAAVSRYGGDLPGTAHFFGRAPGRERLLHVHLHDRVLTGEDLIHSHTLPLARALLESPAHAHGVRVPTPAQETLLTVLKHAIRWGSLPDAAMAWLRPKREQEELARLLTDANVEAAAALLGAHGLALDDATFRRCAAALRARGSGAERRRLAARVRRALRPFANQGASGRAAAYTRVLVARVRRLLDGDRRDKALRGRGLCVAFVGGEAAARAALVAETARWLGQAFALRTRRAPAAAAPSPGEIVLCDGEPAGRAPDLRIEVERAVDAEAVRTRIWEIL
jgi:hypothetical protein